MTLPETIMGLVLALGGGAAMPSAVRAIIDRVAARKARSVPPPATVAVNVGGADMHAHARATDAPALRTGEFPPIHELCPAHPIVENQRLSDKKEIKDALGELKDAVQSEGKATREKLDALREWKGGADARLMTLEREMGRLQTEPAHGGGGRRA